MLGDVDALVAQGYSVLPVGGRLRRPPTG